ncbi:MAG: sigma-70 family RNA polymerase sigma factor [Gemmatimonadales bacterium]|nr:sigma-70 family RNA polymerase sigma factor [Gemmatimonadales bacterium]
MPLTVSSSRTEPTAPAPAAERCAAWYAEHGDRLYRYLRFHAPSADLADDLVAETFLRALRAADRYDPARGPVLAWLLRIGRNVLRDHLRATARRPTAAVDVLRDLACDAPSAEERLLWEERVAELLAALRRLPEADRELVSLRYGSELSPTEIATLLGLREAVVRTRLWRALGRLRAGMGVA